MAKADVISEVVTTIKGVTLTLTLEEAETLQAILCHVGGARAGGHRDRVNDICSSLSRAGITYDSSFIQGSMYIKNK